MSWDIIEVNWKHLKDAVRQQWGNLTDDHLEKISGKREHLISHIQQSYGVSGGEAERQVKDWQVENHDLFAETAAAVRQYVGISRQ